jgi:hypothetical protein
MVLPRRAAVGRDKAREHTVLSEHATAADAFAGIERLAMHMSAPACLAMLSSC